MKFKLPLEVGIYLVEVEERITVMRVYEGHSLVCMLDIDEQRTVDHWKEHYGLKILKKVY